MSTNNDLYKYIVRLADDRIILGHRLSEWSGHGPILEEDLALTNISLDLLGAAQELYKYAASINDDVKDENDIAYFRYDYEYSNLLLTEQPNGDYAQTMLRQFLFDTFSLLYLNELKNSKDEQLSAIAEKTLKETKYHWRHSSEWIVRFGDGTDESRRRLLDALEYLWMYTAEMFENDEVHNNLFKQGIVPDIENVKKLWFEKIEEVFLKAKVDMPDKDAFMQSGGRKGNHTEYLGYILNEMQYLTRSMPNAEW